MSNPPQRPRNPPGLTALAYRVGDYTQAMQRALESLYIAIPPATSTLAALRTRDGDDATIALIDAWAMVIDVLTFYQERIANEGYWRTATERRSLLELARTIGCELQPGVAASTYLMFTVDSAPTSPNQVTVPQGTQIASIPGENEQSQTFETSEPFIARVDWNALKPRLTRPQTLTSQTQRVYLQGTSTQLQVGDRLLLIDEPLEGESSSNEGELLTLTAVESLTASGQTRITWKNPPTTVSRRPRLLAFRQQMALFGNLAPKWETLPAEMKQRYSPVKGGSFRFNGQEWRSVTVGLPSLDVRCLAIKSPQLLFAGTLGGGIFRSFDRGESWQAMTIGLSNLAIETLYCSEQGQVFAGTPGGGVFRSRDNGETWTAINAGTVRVQSTGENSWDAVNTALPNTVVRCLLAYTVLAPLGSGTLTGEGNTIRGQQTQFRAELRVGESITSSNQSHKIIEIKSDTELITDQEWNPAIKDTIFITSERDFLFVGTDDGVYRSADQGRNWYSKGLATRSVRALLESVQVLQTQGKLKSVPKKDGEVQSLTNLEGDETAFISSFNVGDIICIGNDRYRIIAIDNEQKNITISPPLAYALTDATAFHLLSCWLYAATDQGVYRSNNQGDRWELFENFTKNTTCLATLPQPIEEPNPQNHYVFAGTASEGIHRYNEASNTWEQKVAGLTQLDITTLAVQGAKLYAGTGSGKIFVSENQGETWNELKQTPIATGITALAASEIDLFVGTRFAGFAHTDWSPSGQPITSPPAPESPPPVIVGDRNAVSSLISQSVPEQSSSTSITLDLNAIYPQILPNSWIVLLNEKQVQPVQVQMVTTALATGFTLSAQVTRLTCKAPKTPVSYHPQTTIVLAQSEALTLAETSLTVEKQQEQIDTAIAPIDSEKSDPWIQTQGFQDPIGRDRIFLEQFVQGLQPGQKLIVSGQRPRLEICQVGGVFKRQKLAEAWQHDNQGLTNLAVLSLLTTPQPGKISLLAFWLQWYRNITLKDETLDLWFVSLTYYVVLQQIETIFAGTANGLFGRQKGGSSWEAITETSQSGNEIPIDHSICVLHQTALGDLFAGTESGLLRSQDNGITWRALNSTFKNDPVRALVSTPNFVLYLATEASLFRLTNRGETWVAINRDLLAVQVQSLSVNTQGHLFAGSQQHGVFRSMDQGENWTQVGYSGKPGTGAIASTGSMVIGTGTLFSEELKPGDLLIALGQTRTIIGLDPDHPNSSLTIDEPFASPGLPAGTPFVLSTGLTNLNITALATYARPGTGKISIPIQDKKDNGTNNGKNDERRNEISNRKNDTRNVEGTGTDFLQELRIGDAITVGDQSSVVIDIPSRNYCMLATAFQKTVRNQPFTTPMVFAGTAGGGVFRSTNNGEHWQAMNQGLTDLNITTLVAYEHPGSASLEIVSTTITATPHIPLKEGALITIGQQTRRVTAILSEESNEQSSAITFSINVAFDNVPPSIQSYTVQALVAGTESGGVFYSLDQGEHWKVDNAGLTNTAIRAIAPPHQESDPSLIGGVGILPSPEGLETVPLIPGDSLQVLAPPTVLESPNALQWHLRDVNGFVGVLTTTTAVDVALHPALVTDEVVSELVTLLTPPTDQQTPILVLQKPLQACYDPASVSVHANVVNATHGETIAERPEVLGSGDGTLKNQRFFLKKPPLTYVSAATAEGIASSLEVRVNDLLWKAVPALDGLQPTDQVYLVQTDDDGNTSITFGDGINGARLPSGLDNVVATYRSGIGLAGNLAAGKLSLLKTRPLGIQSVTNPLPATGAADPESRDDIRERAPLTIRTLDRVVSLQDVEDYTRTFPGIGKAIAISIWAAHAPVIHVTIAGSDGAAVPPDSALYQNLVQAIAQVHDPYQLPPTIASYERIGFEVSATLLIDPRYLPNGVQAAVQARLQQSFAFASRDFGQPVTASEVIALIQSVEGVIAVDLDFLHRIDAPKTLEQCLTASLAQWHPDTQQFTPAQLLLLHRIHLTTQFPTP